MKLTKKKFEEIQAALKEKSISDEELDAYFRSVKKERDLLCAEYFLCSGTIPADIDIEVGDYLITNIGIEKVVSVSSGTIVTQDDDIDYSTAKIIDIRSVFKAKERVYGRNPSCVDPEDYSEPKELFEGFDLGKKERI